MYLSSLKKNYLALYLLVKNVLFSQHCFHKVVIKFRIQTELTVFFHVFVNGVVYLSTAVGFYSYWSCRNMLQHTAVKVPPAICTRTVCQCACTALLTVQWETFFSTASNRKKWVYSAAQHLPHSVWNGLYTRLLFTLLSLYSLKWSETQCPKHYEKCLSKWRHTYDLTFSFYKWTQN